MRALAPTVAWVPRRGVLGAAVALGVVVAAVAAALSAWFHAAPLFPASLVAALGMVGLASWVQRRYRSRFEGSAELTREGVFLGGRLAVKRGSIQEARLARSETGFWFVHVFTRLGGVVTLEVVDKIEGRALIDALQLDAGSATSRFTLTRHNHSRVGLLAPFFLPVLAALLVVPFVHFPGSRLLPALGALAAFLVTFFRMRQLVIGADGLLVRDGFSPRPRFIAHDAIDEVVQEGTDVLVRLRDGETLRFPMGFDPPSTAALGMASGLLKRIREARAVFAARGGSAPALAALARAGRTTPQWLDALRRAGDEAEGGFRNAVAGRDRLWALVVGAQTPPTTRVAAAVALRVAAQADDDTRARIRAVAASCASPELATRIRIAAEGDDDEVEALLEKVEPSARRVR